MSTFHEGVYMEDETWKMENEGSDPKSILYDIIDIYQLGKKQLSPQPSL